MDKCDHCGTQLIDMCYKCGAPVCCPKCCAGAEPPGVVGPVERLVMHFPFVGCEDSRCSGPGIGKCSECALVPIPLGVRSLLEEVIGWHSDQQSGDYNACDTSPCMWCVDAKSALS